MTLPDVLVVLMFLSTVGFLMAGFPVAFTLAGSALLWSMIAFAFGTFDVSFFGALPSRIFGNAMTNEILIAVPLFIFMGVMLERSKVAEELLDTMGQLFGALRGGLGISVSVVGDAAGSVRRVTPVGRGNFAALTLPLTVNGNSPTGMKCLGTM